MGLFYIDTSSGDFATHTQLADSGLLDRDSRPLAPWHRVQGTGDASTLWYALMRKPTRGIWLGALAMRGSDQHERLLAEGWEEVAPERCGASLAGGSARLSPTPFDAEGWERLNRRLE